MGLTPPARLLEKRRFKSFLRPRLGKSIPDPGTRMMRTKLMNVKLDLRLVRVRLWFQRIGHAIVRSDDVKRGICISRAGLATFGVTMLLTAVVAVCSLAASDDEGSLKETAASVFPRLPKDAGTAEYPVTPERVRLGRMLFFDPRMSDDGTVSCSRCHQPSLYATEFRLPSRSVFTAVPPPATHQRFSTPPSTPPNTGMADSRMSKSRPRAA